jgi:hypothetical protein
MGMPIGIHAHHIERKAQKFLRKRLGETYYGHC